MPDFDSTTPPGLSSNPNMALACEDLARYGVVLIPPPAAEYSELLADIEHRLRNRPPGAPPAPDQGHAAGASAILVNRSSVAIASIAYIWTFRRENGRTSTHLFSPGTNPSALLPFGLDERYRAIHSFWHTIFPGSKRLMTSGGALAGDNTDIRSPAAHELWHGGFAGSGGRSSGRKEILESVKLTLDGVFFADGGFAGSNQLGFWESTVSSAEAHLECAALAREARAQGTMPGDFFMQVQTLLGLTEIGLTDTESIPHHPPPPPPSLRPDAGAIRQRERQIVAWRLLSMRRAMDGRAIMARGEAWADAPVPRFHRLESIDV